MRLLVHSQFRTPVACAASRAWSVSLHWSSRTELDRAASTARVWHMVLRLLAFDTNIPTLRGIILVSVRSKGMNFDVFPDTLNCICVDLEKCLFIFATSK